MRTRQRLDDHVVGGWDADQAKADDHVVGGWEADQAKDDDREDQRSNHSRCSHRPRAQPSNIVEPESEHESERTGICIQVYVFRYKYTGIRIQVYV